MAETPERERIAKRMARAGVASRRDAERLILFGRVTLNGTVLTTPATLVGTEDVEGIPGFEGVASFTLRVEFHDEGGKTRLVLRQGPYSTEMEGMAREGWNSSFTKLDTLLAA